MKAAHAGNNLWAILPRPWVSLSPPSRRLIAIGAVLLQIMVVLVSLALLNMRQLALQNARQDAENLGLAIAEQTAGAVQEIDLVLAGSQKQIAVDGLGIENCAHVARQRVNAREVVAILGQQQQMQEHFVWRRPSS